MSAAHASEKARHADSCLTEVSSSAAACSCGHDRAMRVAERDAWQNGLEQVEMTHAELDALLEYSTTLPTGTTIGKRWKRQLYIGPKRGAWLLGEYVPDEDPAYVGITWREIKVVPPEPDCTCGAVEVSAVAQHLVPCPLARPAEGGDGR